MLLHSISIHEINLMKLKIKRKTEPETKQKIKQNIERATKCRRNLDRFHWCDVEPVWRKLISQ